MKKLRSRFDRFCYRNRDKGIPNLMLYISIGTGLVYLISTMTNNYMLYDLLAFDRDAILHGQVWRLFTYVFTAYSYNIVMMLVMLLCYFSLGRAVENVWGTFRFNLFYLIGVLMCDIFSMIFGYPASTGYLNLSLVLAYATLFPEARFLVLYIIPVPAWLMALAYLVPLFLAVFSMPFTWGNLYPLLSLANYFLFFGKDVLNVIPMSWRANAKRLFRKKQKPASGAKPIPFPSAGSYQATTASPKAPYNHRCTICGKTDVSDPDLEFRYCSRCSGYHCYCQDHISNHTHIQS